MKAEEFWYGRINKHPEDCSREEIFRLTQSYASHKLEEYKKEMKEWAKENLISDDEMNTDLDVGNYDLGYNDAIEDLQTKLKEDE